MPIDNNNKKCQEEEEGTTISNNNDSNDTSINNETDTEIDDDCFAEIGVMFEESLPTTLKKMAWQTQEGQHIRAAINMIDDIPGAVQSGHYLWPGAPALCNFLVQRHDKDFTVKSMIELGAGCGLVSAVALQVYTTHLQCVVVTDHDPGTLNRARDNFESTLEELYEKASSEDAQLEIINQLGSIPVEFETLEWGKDVSHVTETVMEYHELVDSSHLFDLVLGSDLIYCDEVVESLFQTASMLMQGPNSRFYLSQSFKYDDSTEEAINAACDKYNLERIVHVDDLANNDNSGSKIQEFHVKKEVAE